MDQISRWLAQSVKLPKLLLPDGFDTISNLKRSLQAIKTKPLSSITSDWTAETTPLIWISCNVKRHLVAIVWNLSTLCLNVFLQVVIAKFLGKEKPRGSLLPFPRRLAQRRVTRSSRSCCRKVYNSDHPPLSEMCHILSVWAQCATICFITAPCVPAQSPPTVVNKGARERESKRKHVLLWCSIVFLKWFPQWNLFHISCFCLTVVHKIWCHWQR